MDFRSKKRLKRRPGSNMFLKEMSIKNSIEIEELILKAFAEDSVHRDITSEACIAEDLWAQGRILLKAKGCIAGLKFLPWIFQLHDPRIETHLFIRDGQMCESGTIRSEERRVG